MRPNLDGPAQTLISLALDRECFKPVNPLFAPLFQYARALAVVEAMRNCRDLPDEKMEAGGRQVLACLRRARAGVIRMPAFQDMNGDPSPDAARVYMERDFAPLLLTDAGEHFLAIRHGNHIVYLADEISFVPPRGFLDGVLTTTH